MAYKIEFIPEAAKDYKELDGSIKKLVNKKIEEIENNPFLGEKLGNKFNIDLTGVPPGNHKIYVRTKDSRGYWSYNMSGDFTILNCTPPAPFLVTPRVPL